MDHTHQVQADPNLSIISVPPILHMNLFKISSLRMSLGSAKPSFSSPSRSPISSRSSVKQVSSNFQSSRVHSLVAHRLPGLVWVTADAIGEGDMNGSSQGGSLGATLALWSKLNSTSWSSSVRLVAELPGTIKRSPITPPAVARLSAWELALTAVLVIPCCAMLLRREDRNIESIVE